VVGAAVWLGPAARGVAGDFADAGGTPGSCALVLMLQPIETLADRDGDGPGCLFLQVIACQAIGHG
jgi:hypothetical protein